MTGRYVRRAVPVIDTSTVDVTGRPRLEAPTEPILFEHNTRTEEPSSSSGSISSSSTVTPHSGFAGSVRSSSPVWSATDNFTERSSVYSLAEDEFDRQESQKVQQLFNNIDSMLFEESVNGPTHLRNECHEWMSAFPHLRIVGQLIIPTQDFGFRVYRRQGSVDDLAWERSTAQQLTGHFSQELAVQGQSLGFSEPSSSRDSLNSRQAFSFHATEGEGNVDEEFEEVIEQEGVFEEYIAVDCSEEDSADDSEHPRWRRVPPVTPSGCVQSTVEQNVFSGIWSEAVDALKPVIQMHAQSTLRLQLNYSLQRMTADILTIEDTPRESFSPLPSQSFNRANRLLVLPDNSISRQPSVLSMFSVNSGSYADTSFPLDRVLTISSKPLLAPHRRDNKTTGCHESDLLIPPTRPGSSLAPLSSRVVGGKKSDQQQFRPNIRPRLAPITPSADHARTPGTDDDVHVNLTNEVLRGIRMATINERLATPPSRSDPLPPIITRDRDLTMLSELHGSVSRTNSNSNAINNNNNNNNNNNSSSSTAAVSINQTRPRPRGTSAVPRRESKHVLAEREKSSIANYNTGRPRTSHTLLWSDTSSPFAANHRSSTTIGFSSLHNQHPPFHVDPTITQKLEITGKNNATNVTDFVAVEANEPVDQPTAPSHAPTSTKWTSTQKRSSHTNGVRKVSEGGTRRRNQVYTAIR